MLAVYGKKRADRKFMAFDMTNNIFVNKRIYMSIFDEEQQIELEREVAYMNKNNQDYKFEIRKIR